MFSLVEQMEITDAQTRSKRQNRLLLYRESEVDEVLRKNNDKIRAMQDLKPIWPWTDKFRQGEFVIRKYLGVRKQIQTTKRQIDAIKDFRDEILLKQSSLSTEPPFPGRGNIQMDLTQADQEAETTEKSRQQELSLIQNLTHQKLAMAVSNLRPPIGKPFYVSNNEILRMTSVERAQYLTETLGADETTILSAASKLNIK